MELFEQHLKKLSTEVTTNEQRQRLMEAMRTYEGDDSIESSLDIETRLKNGEQIPTYTTGIEKLDDKLRGGFRPGQLIIVSAITGHGKTEFCIFLVGKMFDKNPLYFSYEDGPDELVERFMDRGVQVPMFYTPKSLDKTSLSWIEERVVESKVKYDTKVVFIDNLQNLVPRSENRSSEYGYVTRALKHLARKWEVSVVLVHHLNKTDMDVQPNHMDLKGSSDIAQDADTVLLLWRKTDKHEGEIIESNNLILNVSKARRGNTTDGKNIKLTFNGRTYYENDWMSSLDDISKEYVPKNW
jgi:replicative DNA helicase